MTPKEYKNKMMVKVVGSTQCDSEIYRIFRGKIVEVESINYKEQNVCVKTNEDYGYFNLSDVQIATPVMYEGKTEICVGDKIKICGEWLEVYDYVWWNGRYQLLANIEDTYYFDQEDIEALDPLYKEVKEELAVGSEVEIKTKEGKVYQATINNIK